MKKLLKYLPLHFVICLILGICIQYYLKFWQFGFVKPIVILLISLGFLYLFKNKTVRTLLVAIIFVFVGICSVYFNNDVNFNDYYQHRIDKNSFTTLTISKILKENNYAYKYEARVHQIDSSLTRGKVLINLEKDSLQVPFLVDDKIYVPADFVAINPALNPHQFDYKKYLTRQGIHQQIFIRNNHFKKLGKASFSLIGFSASIRSEIQKSLQKQPFSKNTYGVINALLLGQRQDVSKELLNDYANAGAIHILAVSGLHVGIILLILNFFLKPLERLKKGKIIKLIFVVILLWFFALIAGLSASVVRAVTMFTFVAIGQSFQRKHIVEFSLISSAFLLLIVKPMFLFDVGFQLSYLAVFGIVWVQPKLYNLWIPKYFILDKFWGLTTVSVAAQMGVLPLSLFYFHQFPGLFFLSNLVIIPVLGAILIGGILVIIASLLDVLSSSIAAIYNTVITFMNNFIHWVSTKEGFLFQEISMSFLLMFASYLLIITLFQVSFKFSYKKLMNLFIVIILFQGVLLFEKKKILSKNEFVIFHKNRKSIYGKRFGKAFYLMNKIDATFTNQEYIIQNYKVGEQLDVFKNKEYTSYFKIGNQDFLIVDELGVYKLTGLENPIIILQNSPKLNLERLIKTINPKQIIADGNNYKSYVKRWKKICEKEEIPFYPTSEKGAFVLIFKL